MVSHNLSLVIRLAEGVLLKISILLPDTLTSQLKKKNLYPLSEIQPQRLETIVLLILFAKKIEFQGSKLKYFPPILLQNEGRYLDDIRSCNADMDAAALPTNWQPTQ